MPFSASYHSYKSTKAFSALVEDYLDGNQQLAPFYKHRPDYAGIEASIQERKKNINHREALVSILTEQYRHLDTAKAVQENIQSLASENTFTICTAHQPNIFTGHLYFIYKIVHAIKIADELNKTMPDYRFVPVYFMGSEDADLDELGEVFFQGGKYQWKTKQKGAVGRMKVDDSFINLMNEIELLLASEPFGNEIMDIVKSYYKMGESIEQATFQLLNHLFASKGLVIFLPDQASCKKIFLSVLQKELEKSFSYQVVSASIKEFPTDYKIQVVGREINIFYLKDDIRERIERYEDKYVVKNTPYSFTKEQILQELHTYPERFSPNVILRPVFQEMLLPNIVFIGGGGELAYWLELKKLFESLGVPYPVLVLRNSFMIVQKKQTQLIKKLLLDVEDFFDSIDEIFNKKVKSDSKKSFSLEKEKSQLVALYEQMKLVAGLVDITLVQHAEMLCNKALHKIEQLEKKILRSEKRKNSDQLNQIKKVKNGLYPNGNLQERVENGLFYYARYGASFMEELYLHSKTFDQHFCVLKENQ